MRRSHFGAFGAMLEVDKESPPSPRFESSRGVAAAALCCSRGFEAEDEARGGGEEESLERVPTTSLSRLSSQKCGGCNPISAKAGSSSSLWGSNCSCCSGDKEGGAEASLDHVHCSDGGGGVTALTLSGQRRFDGGGGGVLSGAHFFFRLRRRIFVGRSTCSRHMMAEDSRTSSRCDDNSRTRIHADRTRTESVSLLSTDEI